MKKISLILALMMTTPLFIFAQTARVQVIHNSADAAAAEVDIYLNGMIAIPELNYMEATPFVDLPADAEITLDIVPSGMDIASSVYNVSTTLMSGESYILVADGIVSGSGYDPAPAFNVEIYAGAREMASDMMNTDVLVHHGSTDAPTVDVYEQGGTLLADDLMFTDFAGYLELPTNDYYLQLRDETGMTTLLAYDAPLASLELDGAAITVVASGFLNPANNMDGQAFGLYAVTAAGGAFLPLETSMAKVQVIHNSADALASTVDVYLNDEILLPDFAYMTATPFVDVPAGVELSIDIAPGNSMDASESIYNLTAPLMADETYILVADGIVSGSGYDPAPAFNVEIYAGARQMASDMMNTDVLVHHGSTDAPTVDVYEQGGTLLADDLMFTDFAGYLELPTNDYYLQLRDETGMTTLLAYDAPLASLELDGAAITVVASGFLNPANNMDGQAFGLYAVTAAGGAFLPLETSMAKVQVIHNSADALASTVDVYLNDEILLPDFAYMTATPFVDVPAGVELSIDIAPGNSMDASESIYNLTAPLMANESYILVANGVIDTENYDPAPAFDIDIFSGAREMAIESGNTDVLVHHGSTDAPTVDIYEASNLELVNDIAFRGFSSDYLELPTSAYTIQVRLENGIDVVKSYDADLATLGLENQAIFVMASGFLNTENNNDGAAFGLFAVLSDGTVVALEESTLSVSQNSILDSNNLNLYPNPASNHVQVALNMKYQGDLDIRIFNLKGQMVLNSNYYNLAKGQNIIELPVSNLNSGLYTVHFVSEDNVLAKQLKVLR